MSAPIASLPLPGAVNAELLLRDLLDASLTGIQLLRPVYAPDGTTVADFAFSYTNPVGLRRPRLSTRLRTTSKRPLPIVKACLMPWSITCRPYLRIAELANSVGCRARIGLGL